MHVTIKFFSCCPYTELCLQWPNYCCLGGQPKVGVKPLKPGCVFLLANSKRFWCGSVYWVEVKLREEFNFHPPSCHSRSHWSQDKLEEALHVSMRHFLPLLGQGCASPLIPEPVGHVEVHVPLMGIPFGEEFQAFPHPQYPFKELIFIVQWPD